MMGRAGSKGFPGKNLRRTLGRRLFEYPLIACKNSNYINKVFVSTDCPTITKTSKKYGATIIKRPKSLANSKALGEYVYEHAYFEIKKLLEEDDLCGLNITIPFKEKIIPYLSSQDKHATEIKAVNCVTINDKNTIFILINNEN
mgnify:CR=1 FL=1